MLTFGLLEPGKGTKSACLDFSLFGLLGCLFIVGGCMFGYMYQGKPTEREPSREMSQADEPSRCPSTQGREKKHSLPRGWPFF